MEGDWQFIVRALGKTFSESRQLDSKSSISSANFTSSLAWAKYHRILTHIQNDLQNLACHSAQKQELKNELHAHQQISLKQLALLFRILERFRAERVDFVILKGQPLSQLLYGDASRRMVSDIDLLVAPSQFETAIRALLAINLQPLDSNSDLPKDLRCSKLYRNDRYFFDAAARTRVELHYRLMHQTYLKLPQTIELILGQKEIIQIQQKAIPILPMELNFIYLSAHGRKHAWERLDWLYDFTRFHLKFLNGQLDSVIEIAKKFDQVKEVEFALKLAKHFFKPSHLEAHQMSLSDESRVFKKMSSQVMDFHHTRAKRSDVRFYKLIKFWRYDSVPKQLKFFHHIFHLQYDDWLEANRPMRFYSLWFLTKIPSIILRRPIKGSFS